MGIAVLTTAFHERDILPLFVRHHLAEGVDAIYVAEKDDDGWRDELTADELNHIRWFEDTESWHYQPMWVQRLAETAHEEGHDWLVALDADEFCYAAEGGPIADALADCPHGKLYMRSWQHYDFETRQQDHKRLPKVAWKWQPGVTVENGSHECSVPGGAHGVLDVRELQFRSLDHMIRKCQERSQTLDPAMRSRGDGWHIIRMDGYSREQMEAEWQALLQVPTVKDPIPTRLPLLFQSTAPKT